jgi:hypothetical protein
MSGIDDDNNSFRGIKILARKDVEIIRITLDPTIP